MKEQFNELYDYIVNSNDVDKMHVLGHVAKSMMCMLIDNQPQKARGYIDMLESVRWHNYVTAKEAEKIVEVMSPLPSWSRVAWNSAMERLGLELCDEPYYNEHALFVTMCMVCSDSGETISSELAANGSEVDKDALFRFIYRLSLDKLKDKDMMFNIRSYFRLDSWK